ncbi:hypothetical protein [Bifidobacterium felsineum]|uniref:hypothetical protein n=1 Tax=Bifidobacterium felsineum TaxID=2045440 RepID=UPI0010555C52|nr:hypothetical protein [Bifidobacterium felsineum]MBT1164988.1 hypothetical protein [Bifidobacterium felsineum]
MLNYQGLSGCNPEFCLDWEYDENNRERMFVATVDFTCDGSDMSLSKGPQSMTWYLRLNNDGKTWTDIDHGNG